MKNEIITSVDPKSPVSEIFRTLRTNLQYLNKRDGAETILLTSTLQGEGKSFVAANLAVTFAQAGKSVVIVDTDMRRPRQHKLLNVDMYPGLSNYLSGVNINRGSHEITLKECIYKSSIENLYVLPAGNIPPNPSELLQSEKLGEMIDDLKDRFDVVVFDGAPCLLVTDASIVSRLVDATILVVSQGRTKVDDLKEVKNRIKRVGGNVVGVVLNRVKVSSKRYGEKYYYANERSNDRTAKADNSVEYRHRFSSTSDESDARKARSEGSEDFKKIPTSSYKSKEKKNTDYDGIKTTRKSSEDSEKKDTTKTTKTIKTKEIIVNSNEDTSGSEKIQQILAEINKLKEDK